MGAHLRREDGLKAAGGRRPGGGREKSVEERARVLRAAAEAEGGHGVRWKSYRRVAAADCWTVYLQTGCQLTAGSSGRLVARTACCEDYQRPLRHLTTRSHLRAEAEVQDVAQLGKLLGLDDRVARRVQHAEDERPL